MQSSHILILSCNRHRRSLLVHSPSYYVGNPPCPARPVKPTQLRTCASASVDAPRNPARTAHASCASASVGHFVVASTGAKPPCPPALWPGGPSGRVRHFDLVCLSCPFCFAALRVRLRPLLSPRFPSRHGGAVQDMGRSRTFAAVISRRYGNTGRYPVRAPGCTATRLAAPNSAPPVSPSYPLHVTELFLILFLFVLQSSDRPPPKVCR